MLNKSAIYKIKCKDNGKIYVGSAVNLRKRWNAHRRSLRLDSHHCVPLQNAYNKYGENSIEIEVIELVPDKSQLVDREQYWMDQLEVHDRKIGFNTCAVAGSTLGRNHSEATKKKIGDHHSVAFQGEGNPFFGKSHTAETKEKIRQSRLGSKLSEEHKMKISKGVKNNDAVKKTQFKPGHKMSDADKKKMIESRKKYNEENPLTDKQRKAMRNRVLGEKNPMYGKKLSNETKKRISESLKARYKKDKEKQC